MRNAKSANNFRVGEVRQNLADRPFVRSGTLAQSARRDSFDQAFEFLCCGGLHG